MREAQAAFNNNEDEAKEDQPMSWALASFVLFFEIRSHSFNFPMEHIEILKAGVCVS